MGEGCTDDSNLILPGWGAKPSDVIPHRYSQKLPLRISFEYLRQISMDCFFRVLVLRRMLNYYPPYMTRTYSTS